MRLLSLPIVVLPVAFLIAVASQASGSEEIPSYQKALETFKAEREKRKGTPFSAAERQLMEQAERDLAGAMPDPGLKVGERAPDFSLPNAFDRKVSLTDLLSDGPVILTFYRGAWCPYCNLQLRGLQQTLPYFEQYGARLVAVTPQKPDKSREQVEKDGYPFEVLSDLGDRVIKAYNLYYEVPAQVREIYKQRISLDLAEYNGAGRYLLPVPATFVIDRRGIIQAAFADLDYRKRVEPVAILAALEALR